MVNSRPEGACLLAIALGLIPGGCKDMHMLLLLLLTGGLPVRLAAVAFDLLGAFTGCMHAFVRPLCACCGCCGTAAAEALLVACRLLIR